MSRMGRIAALALLGVVAGAAASDAALKRNRLATPPQRAVDIAPQAAIMPQLWLPHRGLAQLGPQPEPPDLPAINRLRAFNLGATQLSPQPEPPDRPAIRKLRALQRGMTQLGPQPEPPDRPAIRFRGVDPLDAWLSGFGPLD